MPAVSLDGLVLIGPGSEWLWSMVSGLGLAITVLAIDRVRPAADATRTTLS